MSKNRDALLNYVHKDNVEHTFRMLLRWLPEKTIKAFLADEIPFLVEEDEKP